MKAYTLCRVKNKWVLLIVFFFAIAFATSIAFGEEPSSRSYCQETNARSSPHMFSELLYGLVPMIFLYELDYSFSCILLL